jgi:hypothetical protein
MHCSKIFTFLATVKMHNSCHLKGELLLLLLMSGMQKKAFHDGGTDTAAKPFNKVGSQKC